MFDKAFNIAILIEKFQNGEINNAEQQRLDDWLTADPANRKLFQALMQEAVLKERLSAFHAINEQRAWQKIRYSVRKTERKEASVPHTERIVLRRKWARMAIGIAATITLFILGVYIFQTSPYFKSNSYAKYSADVQPGGIGATLTLSDGRSIRLQDIATGELAEEAGVVIRKSKDGQLIYELKETGTATDKTMNTLSTANGETYQVKLPDGTMVWLNAASTLTFPATFASLQERRVKLTGEGYFEVAPNKTIPFRVETPNQEITVVGTHFNVNSYLDEQVEVTTLVEGLVKVSSGKQRRSLQPGQQATVAQGIAVRQADMEAAMAWKNGMFVFNKEPLEQIMRKVARWYDVEIVYEGVDKHELYGGSFSRYENVSSVLRKLELTGGIHFKIEGRRIIATK